ncbi:proton-coupled folate transporter-like isoform X2 [Uranotaenia lowii]|uniref:proton-coupled folate transporter-like isoform X2 n=1 Tax=Uranotaenia lowii TaxID=190385 RepID=UPI00247A3CDA|nr:proton-coupled folate transporter-like isoform X2 [Uranotaenia lowii]
MQNKTDSSSIIRRLHEEEPLVDAVVGQHDGSTTTVPRKRFFILEPPVFLIYYAWYVSTAVLTDQIIYQACTVSLGINQTECALLGKEHESPEIKALEERVQPYSANIIMVQALMDSVLPAVLNLSIGPWSDKFGRKPVLLVTFSGLALSFGLISLISFLSDRYLLDPWFYVIAFVPTAISGALSTILTSVYCYISDVTEEHERGNKMAVLEAVLYGGILVGSLSSSYILKWSDATTVFCVATCAVLLSVLYILLIIRESVPISNVRRERWCCSKLAYLFRPQLILDTLKTTLSYRPNFNRTIILLGVVVMGGNIFAAEDATVFFLFLRKHFNWSVRKYSFYISAETIFIIFGNLLGTYYLQKRLGFSESGIAAIGYFSYFLNSIAIAVAFKSWHLYFASAICLLRGVADPMTRAYISNTAAPEDVGKIFAFLSSFETLMPLGAAPLYTVIYKATLVVYPGAFGWVSAAIFVGCYCLTMVVCVLQSMQRSPTSHESID